MNNIRLSNVKHFKLKNDRPLIIYRNDPIFILAHNHREKLRWYHYFLAYMTFFIGLKVLINFITGTLYGGNLYHDVFADFQFMLNKLTSIGHNYSHSSYEFPYLRDYFDIIIMLLFSAHMTLLHYKWFNLSVVFEELWNKGVLNKNILPENDYKLLTRRYDNIFNNVCLNIIALIGAIFMCYVVYWGFEHVGMCSLLKRPEDSLWCENIFNNWWANPHRGNNVISKLPFIYWYITGSFIFYYIFMHNINGIIVVTLLWRVFKYQKKRKNIDEPILSLIKDELYGGLEIANKILRQVALSITMMLVAILLVLSYGKFSFLNITTYTVFLIIFFGLNPFYLLYPSMIINNALRKFKSHHTKELLSQLHTFHERGDTTAVLKTRLELVEIKEFPSHILKSSSMAKWTMQILFWIIMIILRLKSM